MLYYVLLVAFLSTAALIWRALLLDHAALLAFVEQIPLIGGALSCGFCAALWLSLIGTIVYNPIALYTPSLAPLLQIWIGWFIVGAGVLFLRNLIALLIEAVGVLSHLHHEKH